MVANGNGAGWGQWFMQGIVTVALAALAAFGGIKVGMAQMNANQTAMEQRLNRIEDKLDRLIERGNDARR